MEKLILFLVASSGATLIVTLSTIFEPLRDKFNLSSPQREEGILSGAEKGTRIERTKLFLKELFNCPLCFGFWMGAVMYVILYRDLDPINIFVYSCAAAGASIISYTNLK